MCPAQEFIDLEMDAYRNNVIRVSSAYRVRCNADRPVMTCVLCCFLSFALVSR